ncbi:MAG: hypothetical protein ACIARR_13000, partial [Phycisphaerales bacterium JB059]
MPSLESRSKRTPWVALALAALLPVAGCGSTSNAPVTRRDLVVAKPVSVSPTLPRTPRAAATPPRNPPAQSTAQTPAQTAARSPSPQAPTPPPAGRRPGALGKAPRPGDDLSRPPSPAPGTQVESQIKVAAADPPPDPAPEPRPTPPPATKPTPHWWHVNPPPQPRRNRNVATRDGQNHPSAPPTPG